ncbi:MAG: hypothetical protein D6767_01150 [Candidatus Hydrogenedentota bacterium]|nr:MAG: hypothetical protein D6767_01150 [Candidatus Hydrogenedentota bacterium]
MYILLLAMFRTIGRLAENLASLVLRKKGFKVLARNRNFFGVEIDFLCQKEDRYYFIEIKRVKRKHYYAGYPVFPYKQYQRQLNAIETWKAQDNKWYDAVIGLIVFDENNQILSFNPEYIVR